MQIHRRRELVFEPWFEARVELVRLQARANDGNARLRRELDQITGRFLILRDEDARNRERKECREMRATRLLVERFQICHFSLAEHLQSLGGKALDVTRDREPRARYVGIADLSLQPA